MRHQEIIEFIKIEPHHIDEKHISTKRCYLLFPRIFEIEKYGLTPQGKEWEI
jgi:hypothetical protein